MESQYLEKRNLPDSPGVYFFKKDGAILYIGKATSLRDRVRSYFAQDLIKTRGRLLVDMVSLSNTIDYEKTDSVLEAFIRESELIKIHQPHYNTKEKDNKSFNYVVITKEDFPRVLVVRGRNLDQESVDFSYKHLYGPYPFGTELREAMKLVRRIFPYRDNSCTPLQGKPCFNRTIGLCPGVCTGECTKKDYANQIKHICLFFDGKKQRLVSILKKEMILYAKNMEFEKAGEVKRTLQSLTHIQDISMMRKEKFAHVYKKSENIFSPNTTAGDGLTLETNSMSDPSNESSNSSGSYSSYGSMRQFRMEAYDIAHMSGKNMVGVMVSMSNGEFDKSMYRKFIIKSVTQSNDTAALQEVLRRRFNHSDWALPNVIIIDGGKGQLNIAQKVLNEIKKIYEEQILSTNSDATIVEWPSIVSVVKNARHKAREILNTDLLGDLHVQIKDDIIKLNAEAHRFAITFHKKKRGDIGTFLPRE